MVTEHATPIAMPRFMPGSPESSSEASIRCTSGGAAACVGAAVEFEAGAMAREYRWLVIVDARKQE
jgi:hypothetical protein